jgi:hypothetical protein
MSRYIDLARPRIVVVKQGAKTIGFTIRPIAQEEWFAYFDGIVSTAERDGKEIVQRVDAVTPGVELVDKLLAAQGVTAGNIPFAQRLGVANVLASAYEPEEAQPCAAEFAGGDAVALHAVWGSVEGGAMRRHKDLLHIFKTPTNEQYRRYRRDDSRSHVVGGSRKGMTVYHGAQRTLAALYDELIYSVAGYEANGEPLPDAAAIARHMDTYHKVAAAQQLFAPATAEIEDDEDPEQP